MRDALRAPESDSPVPPSSPRAEVPSFADVIIPRHLNRAFTYLIPARLQDRLHAGSRVRVPFGPITLQGVVVSVSARLTDTAERAGPTTKGLREVLALLDDTPETTVAPDLLELTRLVSERYLAPWGQCLRLILPASTPPKRSLRYFITDAGRKIERGGGRLSSVTRALLQRLAVSPKGLTLASLQRTSATSVAPVLASLRHRGWVREIGLDQGDDQRRITGHGRSTASRRVEASEPLRVDRYRELTVSPTLKPTWWDRLQLALDSACHSAFLLQAPAAQRFACLIEAAGETLARDRTVLIVVPEIARASAIAALARTRWSDRVELLHSGLSLRARDDAWRRIRTGAAAIVVGTRSAVFAPLASIGLIGVDEEEDPALKEESEPRYHAREVAWMRARQNDAVLLLGSAHPSLESLTQTRLEKVTLDKPPTGGQPASLPEIQTVDLRHTPYGTLLSEPMIVGITAALAVRAGQLGAILFLNRKGFAPSLLCRDCGETPHCPQCSVTLTFYKRASRLACHYCGTTLPLPDTCPSCRAARLDPIGFGTERLEEEVRRRFPQARIGRLDRENARTPAQAEAIRRQAVAGELDILIGTQMLFQGDSLPTVGFVGLPHADAGLHLPDFRSAERTYHSLLDTVALARPGDEGGRVLLQTYLPTHHAITAVAHANASSFHDQELVFRKAIRYPPYSHLISLRVTGKNSERVRETAERWADMLKAAVARGGRTKAVPAGGDHLTDEVTILGPIPSAVAQLRGRHRWQLLVKSVNAEAGRQTVRATLEELEKSKGKSGLKFEVDVDPVEMV